LKPATILDDIERVAELANMKGALARGATTILKDNISCTTRSGREHDAVAAAGHGASPPPSGLRRPGVRAEQDRGDNAFRAKI